MQSHLKGLVFFIVLLVDLTALESSAFSAGWVQATAKASGATLYRQASNTSEALGHYPGGTALKVYSPPKNGFYAMYFQAEWKGTHYVWISADELDVHSSPDVDSRQTSSGSNRSGSSRFAKNRFRFGADGSLMSPSDLQTGLGDTLQSFNTFGFHADYERRFSKSFSAVMLFDTYSFNQATLLVAGGTYFVSGYSLMLGGAYYFVKNGPFNLSLALTAGLSLNSAGVTLTSAQINTSNILGVPFAGSVIADYKFYNRNLWIFSGLGAFLKAGYEYQVLSAIPIFPLSSTTQTTTGITLSAPTAALGILIDL